MITDRIGLHSVLLPILIIRPNVKHKRNASNNQKLGSVGEINAKALTPAMHFAFHSFLVEVQMNASHTWNSNLEIRIMGNKRSPQ